MKAGAAIAVAVLFLGTISGYGQLPATAPPRTVPIRPVKSESPEIKTSASELYLTGLARIGEKKLAFIRIEKPGEPSRLLTLAEGENANGVDLVKIDADSAKATVRYGARLQELVLRSRGLTQRSPSLTEKEKDISHAKHHILRAKLERERDEREALEEQVRSRTISR
jgi:hypothetical protein